MAGAWLQTEWPDLKVYLTSVTDHWATVSINGPRARRVIEKMCGDVDLSDDAFPFMSVRTGTVAGVPARIFRISFAGELSFEVNVDAGYGLHVWDAAMEAGEEFGITPYGTEAMHVLRAEKGYVIVGQDTDGSVTPVDLGVGRMVSRRKDFLGRRSLAMEHLVREDRKQLVGLLTEDDQEVLPEGGTDRRRPVRSRPGADAGPRDFQLLQRQPQALHRDGHRQGRPSPRGRHRARVHRGRAFGPGADREPVVLRPERGEAECRLTARDASPR